MKGSLGIRASGSVTTLLLLFSSGVATACDAQAPARAAVREPAHWLDDSALSSTGFGEVSFAAKNGRPMAARIYRSKGFDPANGPIWFVMHGASRDVERYVRAAAPVAERHDALAIAIHFTKQAYPKSSDYTVGRWRAPEDTPHAEVERVFSAVLGSLGGRQAGYYLFGHSAGAQFTHRLLTFLTEPRVLGAVAANAGWYTLPAAADPRMHAMPYGLCGGPVDPQQLVPFFETPFVVLLSENDTTTTATDDMVLGTPEAQAQGATRVDRGQHYFAVAKERAAALGAKFAWRLEVLPKVGHDAAQTIDSAGFLTFVPGAKSCAPSSATDAAGLMITEILADPPAGIAGDANRDGVRDADDDEFVEIVNRGANPVCLAGWTLGDAASADRHVFPLGPILAPGASLVVFGGGVPTGRFAGAQVQWAEHGLSLSNAGDVLTLRDASGVIALQVSWGDCADLPRAGDHWPGTLAISASLTRSPESRAPWEPHSEAEGCRYSPGVVRRGARK